MTMKIILRLLATVAIFTAVGSQVHAAPCMSVTLTGTQGGPPVFKGQAGAGTLVQSGDAKDNCSALRLQFDTRRGTTQRLS